MVELHGTGIARGRGQRTTRVHGVGADDANPSIYDGRIVKGNDRAVVPRVTSGASVDRIMVAHVFDDDVPVSKRAFVDRGRRVVNAVSRATNLGATMLVVRALDLLGGPIVRRVGVGITPTKLSFDASGVRIGVSARA